MLAELHILRCPLPRTAGGRRVRAGPFCRLQEKDNVLTHAVFFSDTVPFLNIQLRIETRVFQSE